MAEVKMIEKELKNKIMKGLKACDELCCGECPYQHLDDGIHSSRCIHTLIQDIYKLLKQD